jgi:hypothetical protein
MRRRTLIAAAASLPWLHGCAYTSEYPLSWDEEVLLHDGRMIVVRVTRYFTRTIELPTFHTQYILRDMEIEFDAGPPWGRYRRRFVGYARIAMLDHKDGNWYLKILGDPGKHRITPPRYPVWVLGSDGTERAAQSREEIPDFPRDNILPYTGPETEFFRFKGSIVSWDAKINYWRQYPRAPGDVPELHPNKPVQGDPK